MGTRKRRPSPPVRKKHPLSLIGQRVLERLGELDWSLQDLASEVDVTPGNVSRQIRMESWNKKTVIKYAKAMKCPEARLDPTRFHDDVRERGRAK